MKIKLASFIVAIGLLTTSNAVFAETPVSQPKFGQAISPEKLALAKELVKLYDIKGQWFNKANQSFDKGFANARSDNNTEIKMAIKKIDDYLAQEAVKIEQEMAIVYAQTYTLQELHALNKFYATSEGRTILKKNQQLAENFEAIRMEHLRKMVYEFRDSR